jgi:hypothetical protein
VARDPYRSEGVHTRYALIPVGSRPDTRCSDCAKLIVAVLVHFHSLILKRTHKKFSFRNFSIGNGFLAGARELLGGLPSAIFMFQALTDSQVSK